MSLSGAPGLLWSHRPPAAAASPSDPLLALRGAIAAAIRANDSLFFTVDSPKHGELRNASVAILLSDLSVKAVVRGESVNLLFRGESGVLVAGNTSACVPGTPPLAALFNNFEAHFRRIEFSLANCASSAFAVKVSGHVYAFCAALNPPPGGHAFLLFSDLTTSLRLTTSSSIRVSVEHDLTFLAAPQSAAQLDRCREENSRQPESLHHFDKVPRSLQALDVSLPTAAEINESFERKCASAQEKHPCMFVHGLGQSPAAKTTSTDTSGYWGKTAIEDATPQCRERKFFHLDTVTKGWKDDSFAQAICDELRDMQEQGDALIFTHSMGGLIVLWALNSNRPGCDAFRAGSGQVFLSQMPFYGSIAASQSHDLCTHNNSMVAEAANYMGICKANEVALRSLFPVLNKTARDETFSKQLLEKVGGVLCGTSAFGIVSALSIPYAALGATLFKLEPNDAIVSNRESCAPFGAVANNVVVTELGINHGDGTMRNGDSWLWFGSSPSQWFKKASLKAL